MLLFVKKRRFCYSVNRSCPMINIIIWKYLKYVWLCCMISNTYGTTKWPSSVNKKKKKLKFRLVLYCLWTDKIIVALFFFKLLCFKSTWSYFPKWKWPRWNVMHRNVENVVQCMENVLFTRKKLLILPQNGVSKKMHIC